MKYLFIGILLMTFLSIMFYILWIKGYLIISRKTAKLFIGSLRNKERCRIKFASCNGYIKKIIKFKENRTYDFCLKSKVENGLVLAEIWDSNKKILLHLNSDMPNSSINVDKKCRYYLFLKFEKATGELELLWN